MITAKEAGKITWEASLAKNPRVSDQEVTEALKGIGETIRAAAGQNRVSVHIDLHEYKSELRELVLGQLLALEYKVHGTGLDKYIINWSRYTGSADRYN